MTTRKSSAGSAALICHTIVTVALIGAYVATREPEALAAAVAWGGGAGLQKAVGG